MHVKSAPYCFCHSERSEESVPRVFCLGQRFFAALRMTKGREAAKPTKAAFHARFLLRAAVLACLVLSFVASGSEAARIQTAKVSSAVVLAGGPGIQQSASMAGHVMAYANCVGGNCDVVSLDLNTKKV